MKKLTAGVFAWLMLGLSAATLSLPAAFSAPQKIETIDGVRVVRNKKGGQWGNNPKISIELIRTIGDLETTDENLAFNDPSDIAVDNSGNIYVLDSGNSRVQKFDPEGQYLATIGGKGQGPAEFESPRSLDIDADGYIYVLDDAQKKIVIFTPEGKEHKIVSTTKLNLSRVCRLKSGSLVASGYAVFQEPGEPKEKSLPKLAKIIDSQGDLLREFGEPEDYGDEYTNATANWFQFAVDGQDNIFLSFGSQNRLEKYSPDGQLRWKADRELNYSTKLIERAKREVTKTSSKFMAAKMNRVSSGVAADNRGRVWVVTLDRQIKKEEEITTIVSGGPAGATRKIVGNTDLQTTDMYKLEIYAPDGVLLGEIPVSQFVNGIRIWKDRLFLLDSDRGVKFYEYLIREK